MARGTHIKRTSGQLNNLFFQSHNNLFQFATVGLQRPNIHTNALALHPCQNRHQWHLNVAEHLIHPRLCKLGFENLFELERNVGILSRIIQDLVRRQIAHVPLILALADQRFDRDALVVQISFREDVHVVAHIRLDQIMRNHRVEQRAFDLHAVVHQDADVVFDVLSNFFTRTRPKWRKRIDHFLCRSTIRWHRYIIGLAFSCRKTHSH